MTKVPVIFLSLFSALLVWAAPAVKVLGTTAPVTAFVKVVLQDVPGYNVEQLLPAAVGCPHDYALTPNEVKRLASAKIIVENGLGMEGFLDAVLKRVNPKAVVIDSSFNVKRIIAGEHGHHHGEHKGHKHENCMNEHLFGSPEMAAEVVRSIAESFAKIDTVNASKFKKNADKYISELKKISRDYAAFAAKVPASGKYVAVQHSIFDYMVREAGLHSAVCLQEHSGHDPSAAEIRHLIREIQEHHVRLILAEKNMPSRVTETIARDAKALVLYLELNPGTSDPSVMLKLYRENLIKLRNGLQIK